MQAKIQDSNRWKSQQSWHLMHRISIEKIGADSCFTECVLHTKENNLMVVDDDYGEGACTLPIRDFPRYFDHDQ